MDYDIFDTANLARCAKCGEAVQTLKGWPIPVAACVECDVWTIHRPDQGPETITPQITLGSGTGTVHAAAHSRR